MAVKQLDRFLKMLFVFTSYQLVEVNVEERSQIEDCARIRSIKTTLLPIETDWEPPLILLRRRFFPVWVIKLLRRLKITDGRPWDVGNTGHQDVI